MLGSSSYSHHHEHQQNQDQELHLQPDLTSPQPPPAGRELHYHQIPPPSSYLRQLLLTCARSISLSDFTTAHSIATVLSSNSSPSGDSSERLIHSFTKALSLRLPPSLSPTSFANTSSNNNDAILQSSYLTLNQITPFIRFTHLTATQAILEAIDQPHQDHIHILDFDIMHGVQWPPLMQAIADHHPPLTLRITAVGTDLNILRKTGDRLSKFAHSLGLRFRFFPLLLTNSSNETVDDVINHLSTVDRLPNETLVVNCVLYLHRMLVDRDKVVMLLKKIKSMNPRVVTLAEKEANHNNPLFVSRFEEALSYYSAVFESLEVTLPPNSRERMVVEQVWFGREIVDIVVAEGESRRERHERFVSWERMMKIAGFRNVALSPFAVSQAKLLLRLHYPCDGYNLEVANDCLFLGWNYRPLFSVSSWH
ncbi:putative transcription factor GRAS family [Helianthus debilis subsp. tardiflorus]